MICPPEFFLMTQTPKAQNIENRRHTITLDCFERCVNRNLMARFIAKIAESPIFFSASLYALVYGC